MTDTAFTTTLLDGESAMSDDKKPILIVEFETEAQAEAYDRWFRAKVQAAIDNPGKLIRTMRPWPACERPSVAPPRSRLDAANRLERSRSQRFG